MADLLSIGEVARLAAVSVDTIRYYERIGLLPAPARTAAGYRKFPNGVVRRLALVKNAQRFGFALREIAVFLRAREAGGKPCHDVRAAARRMLDAVDREIEDLIATRRRMRTTLRSWDRMLARTPAGRRAHLLESLDASPEGPAALPGFAHPGHRRGHSAKAW